MRASGELMCLYRFSTRLFDDRIARCEERDQTLDQMPLRPRHLVPQIGDVGREIHFLHCPGVLDGVPVHLVEDRVLHRAQSEVKTRI